jgi:3D (Asp-Asp-Asp) domain-containing protein
MKYPIAILALFFAFLTGCATAPATRSTGARLEGKPGQHMTIRTTAYTHTEAGGARNGVGGRLHFGGDSFSAASDWSWLPLGTRFRMCCNGHQYVIEDYGSALVGRKTVDLYFPSRKQVRDWGVRQVDIEILEWGSHAMSLKLLSGRMGNKHVRKMVSNLRQHTPAS